MGVMRLSEIQQLIQDLKAEGKTPKEVSGTLLTMGFSSKVATQFVMNYWHQEDIDATVIGRRRR